MKILSKWIEVTGHFDHETDGEFVFDCDMPEDGQEILVTLIGGDICRDICHIDKMGYRLESGWDWNDVFKWAPMPPAWWEENGISDLIDRQMLKADLLCGDDAEHDYCFPCKRILERIDNQPSAETHDKRTEMHAYDCVSRKAACTYCHEDSDGYVTPIEKNCHAFIHFGMDGWELSLKANGWHGSAKIMYCPMCGRRLERG